MNRWIPMLTAAALVAGTVSAQPAAETAAETPTEPTPEGVTQLIPRGALASIDEPIFVSAADAEMPDDAWILGVAIDGEAHAYSLNLLNHHEVVNDVIGDAHFAAVW